MCTELSLGCWSSGHSSMYQVSSSTICQLHAHTCPLNNVLLEVVCCCFPRNKLFTYHDYVHRFNSLPSFMLVSAPVSEIRVFNQKKNSEIGDFQ